MKIEPSKDKKNYSFFKGKKASSPSGNITNSAQSFSKSISEQINQDNIREFNHELDRTISELDLISEEVRKNFSWENLEKYKNRLRRFLQTSLKSYTEKMIDHTGNTWSKTNPPKILVSVKIINQNLEEMTKDILSNQRERIKLLARFDLLKGLLRDFKVT
jgi:uncharacterized protein YaaR (DUF327 family)